MLKENFKKLIKNNEGKSFVIRTTNKEEYMAVLETLVEMDFKPSVPLDTLENMMNGMVEEIGYNNYWRVCSRMGVTWNDSLEHWKQYTNDIVGFDNNGKIYFLVD